jgi:hypothetical protein
MSSRNAIAVVEVDAACRAEMAQVCEQVNDSFIADSWIIAPRL